jgi:hypothetical protein
MAWPADTRDRRHVDHGHAAESADGDVEQPSGRVIPGGVRLTGDGQAAISRPLARSSATASPPSQATNAASGEVQVQPVGSAGRDGPALDQPRRLAGDDGDARAVAEVD